MTVTMALRQNQSTDLSWDQVDSNFSQLAEFVNSDTSGTMTLEGPFVAGTGFTPGVTTTFNLSMSYGTPANIRFQFDGLIQGPDQYIISGSQAIFNNPVPVGVTEVIGVGGSSLPINFPANGSVGLAQMTPAAIANFLTAGATNYVGIPQLKADVLGTFLQTSSVNYVGIPQLKADVLGTFLQTSSVNYVGIPQLTSSVLSYFAQSIQLASNTGSSYIGYNQGGAGAVNITQQSKNQQVISIKDFGAGGDGITNDSSAYNAAIAYLNSKLGGGTLFFPDGQYVLSSGLTSITNQNIVLMGSSKYAAVILCSTGGTMFTWSGSNYCAVQNLGFKYASNPIAADVLFQMNNSNHFWFEDLWFNNTSNFLVVGDAAGTNPCSDVWVSRCTGYLCNIANVNAITLNKGAGFFMDSCAMFCNSGVPANNRTSTMTTATNCNFLSAGAFSWDSVQMVNCQHEQFYYGLKVVVGAGVVVNDWYICNTIFDYHSSTAILLQATSTSSGGVFGIRLSNVWFCSWSGDCLDILGPGVVQAVTGNSLHFVCAGYNGCEISTGAKDITLTDVNILAVNRIAGVANGIVIAGGDRITISNSRGGYDCTPLGYAWQASIGLNHASTTATNVIVTGNHFEGSSYGYLIGTGSNFASGLIANNINTGEYSGHQTTGIYTLPSSTVTWINNASTNVEVLIFGGTVSGVSKDGVGISGMTNGSLQIEPGGSYAMTYSSAPSVNYFVKP